MRDFFLIKHHPRGLTEAYQENSRRTRAPRHTLPACAGRYDDEGVISLRQRVVNGMQSEGRVVSHLTDVIRMVFSYRPTGIPGVPLLRKSVLTDQLRPGVTPG